MRLSLLILLMLFATQSTSASDFSKKLKPLLMKYCAECHGNEDTNGEVNFQAIESAEHIDAAFEIWESAVDHLQSRTMPPADSPQPSEDERQVIYDWYQHFSANVESRPAVFRPRRLSVTEYRNTLRSVVGFDLQVDAIEAEQTLIERSMVVKLLPTDPPGESGFKNDTHGNPLSSVAWDQYSYLADAALEELFHPENEEHFSKLLGQPKTGKLTDQHATEAMKRFLLLAQRRPPEQALLNKISERLSGKIDDALVAALKLEMKTVLMSPAFLYRGLLMKGQPGKRQSVDTFELAERLSYFLWADAPDSELIRLASNGSLAEESILNAQVDRMLTSPKARSLATVFATEWFSLGEIEKVSNNPPQMVALKTQPIDFMNFLFTQNRPLLELVDSDVAFINPFVARMYGKDAKQMKKHQKRRGIEVEIVPHQKVALNETTERGGILTMPGVLAMNKGPIIRGTWILERILGDELPDPPANVGQVQPNKRGEKLTFRQRFEAHRSNTTCAACHDKIDPLGFALESFGAGGQYLASPTYKPGKKDDPNKRLDPGKIDTSGRLPSGETFDDIIGLKRILVTTQKESVVSNIVRRTMSYALCRKLTVYDQQTVKQITQRMIETSGTWRDLFQAITTSMPFRETILSGEETR